MRCVWCLSTGRVGTQTLAALGALADRVDSQHEPAPMLYGLSKLSYEGCGEREGRRVLVEAVRSCRSDVGTRAAVYLETSPQVTFLAPILREVFPKSRFLHVVRHPAAVVRSAMRRQWYAGNPFDETRIEPVSTPARKAWNDWTPFEKNLWLWNETNRWIDDFVATLPHSEWLRVRSEDVFLGRPAALESFFDCLEVARPPRKDLERVLGKKLNQQREGNFPEMDDWPPAEREWLIERSGELMERFGYSLSQGV